ncbi:tRNA (5-methylaminomethyl-2-thiouridine)(34)-methyltransferase MnmD [Borreliella tanukii]|uniref:tRNA (5-methylaminomethyl-2-thiouridine)(34)-methyltransferase MnmD n=1 Tax=Borreliella tanukii TaxID=56146 RepID=UPI002649F4DD|nr:tRNA (5-methylaminomethyl-2-thiouridine)(34)-methyltransferase MnmD [Borreliella tanukii]WKC81022.1 tRNA (5-methylaminomethyl-2-thiouridine)(34)-methyltransferase MnmD [Borreliella tanukii]
MKKLIFKERTIYSSKFDDIYYNPKYGIEESFYTFIKGCNLDLELKTKKSLLIAELGFGTGLNFICLLKFIKENNITSKINYYSVEKFPLKKNTIMQISKLFAKENAYFKLMLKHYPKIPKKNLKLKITENVNLKILIGNAKTKIKEIPKNVEYWFLDGFNPKKNPEMWNNEIFNLISEKSSPGCKLSTFSSARIVKDGLKLANFKYIHIEKGFGNKRHMITAQKN